jgi:cytochrome c
MVTLKKIVLLFILVAGFVFIYSCDKSEKAGENAKQASVKENVKIVNNEAISSDVEKGKALFNDVNVIGISKPCNLCHKNGRRLEDEAGNDNLAEDINFCIQTHCKGKTINPDSKEMAYIIAYIKSLKKK